MKTEKTEMLIATLEGPKRSDVLETVIKSKEKTERYIATLDNWKTELDLSWI